jgi:hypothetical protein
MLSFDLEFFANLGTAAFPPNVLLTKPAGGSLFLSGKSIDLLADALDPDGSFVFVTFYADGHALGTRSQAPYSLTWTNPPPGRHQIAATAGDASGLSASAFAVIQVMTNLPPSVDILSPGMDSVYKPGDPIQVQVGASDPNDSVQKVDLYLRPHGAFTFWGNQVGSDNAAPYSFVFNAPAAPGPYVLTAVATDTLGAWNQSDPVHIMVEAPPSLTIRLEPPMVVVDWSPPEAILESAPTVLGPWTVMQNVSPPLRLNPQGQMFFRVHLP